MLYDLEKHLILKRGMICVHVTSQTFQVLFNGLIFKIFSFLFMSVFNRNFRALYTKSEIALLFHHLRRSDLVWFELHMG